MQWRVKKACSLAQKYLEEVENKIKALKQNVPLSLLFWNQIGPTLIFSPDSPSFYWYAPIYKLLWINCNCIWLLLDFFYFFYFDQILSELNSSFCANVFSEFDFSKLNLDGEKLMWKFITNMWINIF